MLVILTGHQDLHHSQKTRRSNTVRNLAKGKLQEDLGGALDGVSDQVKDHGDGQGLGTAHHVREFCVEGHECGSNDLEDRGQDRAERNDLEHRDDIADAAVHQVHLERVADGVHQNAVWRHKKSAKRRLGGKDGMAKYVRLASIKVQCLQLTLR